MTEFLGVSMTLIMAALLAMLLAALGAVALVAARNRVLFSIGIRNIPRRRAQSVLIVLGLMLSTVIISAAFATGDTVEYSITNDAYDKLGRVDELVQVQENQKSLGLVNEQIAPSGIVYPPLIDSLVADLNGNDAIDGVMPVLRLPAPVTNADNKLTEPQASVIGIDEQAMAGFEDDIVAQAGGGRADPAQLRKFDAMVNDSMAKRLNISLNARLDVWANGQPRTFTVRGIIKDDMLSGWTTGQPAGVLIKYTTAQQIFGINGAGFVAISNAGGVRDGVNGSAAATRALETSLGPSSRYEVSAIKRDRVERAKEVGSNMTAIFVVLGLFSIAAGLLLVFLILVMLAAERRPEMGMSRAVGMTRFQLIESFMAEGMAYSMAAALVGAALGVVVSLGMTRAMAYIFNAFDVGIAFHLTARSLVVSFSLGVVLTFLTVVASAWRVSNMSIVAAIREVNEATHVAAPKAAVMAGAALVVAGSAATAWGVAAAEAALFGGGLSLVAIGGALASRVARWPQRAVFTVTSAAVLLLWALVAGGTLSAVTGDLQTGVATFFVSGVLMVAAATVIVVYNADLLLGSVRGIGVLFSRAVPAVRTAIAYPLANKGRTGMTIAMMSLVVFALVMISTMNLNFRRLFLSADSQGGWDVEVQELPTNPVGDANGNPLGPLGEALERKFYDVQRIDSIGQTLVANPRATSIAQLNPDRSAAAYHAFPVLGADETFLTQNKIGLQARAQGYADDRAVWDAVRADASNAVIDGSVVPGINYANVTESRFTLEGYSSGQTSFAPFALSMVDSGTGKVRTVKVIGIMNRGPSETYRGMVINMQGFNQSLPQLFSRYYVRLKPGFDAQTEAKQMEATLSDQGITARSIRRQVETQQQLSTAFFYLLQGFMALGLGVGIVALGVIAFRTVVERRQQIGLMRAIGFSRANIALSFVLESAFISVLGIANGIWLAVLLANRLLASDQFRTAGFTRFYVPWLQIALMAALVFVASVLTTVIPSRQASGIPPAEALRYE